jgi:predicted nucleotidyltransferase
MWRTTMGLPEGDSKERALVQLAVFLQEQGVPYAIIGGVAVQLWTEEPRTTRDIDVALARYSDLPRDALTLAGFKHEGTFEHSDNWRAPGPEPRRRRTVVQFSVDELTPGTVERAEVYERLLQGATLRLASLPDLVALKLAAALEPRRRGSKRVSDYGDIKRLVEEHPDLAGKFPDLPEQLDRVRELMAEDDRKLGR